MIGRNMRTFLCVASGVLALGAQRCDAGQKSLIAGLQTGDEIRYTYTLRADETIAVVGTPGAGQRSDSTETVGILVRCKADTHALNIVEVVYEAFRFSIDSQRGRVDVDMNAPPPDEKTAPRARELYDQLHEIVGTVITINVSPGSGDITTIHGGERLLASPGAPLLKRFVDPELFRATLEPIFQLKTNSAMPPPGQKWWTQWSVFAYAHPGRSPVWETRVVEGVLADVATIKGTTKAAGNPEDASKSPVFFKTVSGDAEYKWDLIRGRLRSATRTEVVNSRYTRGATLLDSDLILKSTLELAPPAVPKPAAPIAREPVPAPAGRPEP